MYVFTNKKTQENAIECSKLPSSNQTMRKITIVTVLPPPLLAPYFHPLTFHFQLLTCP